MKKPFLAIVPVFFLALGLGCAVKPNDAKITSDVQNKFSQDSGLASKQLGVQAQNGTVTLSGTVDNDAQREAAARQAASEPGVEQVINNLQVGAPVPAQAASEPPPAAEPTPAPAIKAAKPAGRNPLVKHPVIAGGAAAAGAGMAMAADSHSDTPPPAPAVVAPPPPPPPVKVTIAQGTQLSVRLSEPLDTTANQPGQNFHATLNTAITADGDEVVPAGSDVIGHIVDLKSSGKFTGQSALVLQLDSIASGGKTYNIQTDQYKKEGTGRGKNTAEKVGGGAVLGGIIGALAGGGKGAAIGATVGAGAGGGVQAASKAPQIKIPAETIMAFTLQAPVTVVKAPNPNANRPKLGDQN
jgi:BON domain